MTLYRRETLSPHCVQHPRASLRAAVWVYPLHSSQSLSIVYRSIHLNRLQEGSRRLSQVPAHAFPSSRYAQVRNGRRTSYTMHLHRVAIPGALVKIGSGSSSGGPEPIISLQASRNEPARGVRLHVGWGKAAQRKT